MKIQRRRKHSAEVATSSLNDIMFFLLLFFLIISTVANPNVIKLWLPKASSSQSLTKQQVTLSITADKQYFINKMPIPFEMLEDELMKATLNTTDPTIVLRADKSLTIQDLVDVLQLSARLGIRMVMATERS